MNSAVIATPPAPAPWFDVSPQVLLGISVGLCAAFIGALYTVFARLGLSQGLLPWDLTFLRFATAGVLLLPFVMRSRSSLASTLRMQWKLWLAMCVLAGPLFGILMFGALQFAPPSHAAVFPFVSMSVMGMVWAAVFLGDRLTARKVLGCVVIAVGLITLSGLRADSLQGRALLGDALFIAAGASWAGFGILLRKYRIAPMQATAVISWAALLSFVPVYLLTADLSRLAHMSTGSLLTQILVQGVIAGCGTLYTYGKMVSILGPARAAVFPALAPGLAALIAWPVLGHMPGSRELLGLSLAMTGLIIAATTFRLLPSSLTFQKASS